MTKGRVQTLFIGALALSILLHGIIVAVVSSSQMHKSVKPLAANQPVKVVEAVAVNQQDVEQEIAHIQAQQQQEAQARADEIAQYQHAVKAAKLHRAREQAQVVKLAREKRRIQQRLQQDRKSAAKHARALARIAKQRKIMQAALKSKAAKEQARLAALKKQSKIAEAKREKAERLSKLAEAKRRDAQKQEQQAEIKRKLALAAQKKAEAARQLALDREHKRKLARLAKLKTAQQDALNKAMLAEQQRISEAHARRVTSEVAQYKARILAAIAHSWRVPSNTANNLSCQLLIHLGPGGVVLDVSTLKSSGSRVLDRSARTAVLKASPLPVPEKKEVFESFRELRLTVRPEQV